MEEMKKIELFKVYGVKRFDTPMTRYLPAIGGIGGVFSDKFIEENTASELETVFKRLRMSNILG
ncbi:hypothetical protein AGMMS49975_25870 [Clostridia bacterium]|nr:hypothetical protein AGMMS49975_25870 [Clostridia bacterium]